MMKMIMISKYKKVVGKIKIETPKSIWIDEFIALRSKAYSFRRNDRNTNNLKGISKSQSKNVKFEEYYSCLFRGEFQKQCDNYPILSLKHEMYLQKVKIIRDLNLMIKCVSKIILKINLGIENYDILKVIVSVNVLEINTNI